LLLASSGRSGSTWLSEVLIEGLRCRYVFEPLARDHVRVARSVPWGRYADPADPDPALAAVMTPILQGRVRSKWSDVYNRARLPPHRHVKEIRATNMLPWLCARYPTMPTVYLLRHPVPAAWSATELGWDPVLSEFLGQPALTDGPLAPYRDVITAAARDDSPFVRHVLRWCMENTVPVDMLAPGSVHVVFYEDLVVDPRGELRRLTAFLGRFPSGRWQIGELEPAVFGRASVSNWRRTRVKEGVGRLSAWQDTVPPPLVERALTLVAAFGLDRLYGAGPTPLVPPDEVLRGSGGAGSVSSGPGGCDADAVPGGGG
jgi:hypothetical protein